MRIVRDPLAHFVVAGGVLFAAYGAFGPQMAAPPADAMRIELTADDLGQIALVRLAQGRAAPTPPELRALAKEEATQRILVREAMALGLDQDDEIIARRLAQKMDFLLADLAALQDPSPDELRTWYAANTERFVRPARASFRHLYFAPDKRGADGARTAAQDALPALAGLGSDAAKPAGIGDRFMFGDYYGGRSSDEIIKAFGPAFAKELFTLAPGRWQGPIQSGYGWHLVYVDTLQPGEVAPLETIEEAVRSAYLEARYREIRERAYAEMLSRYTIVMPDPETFARDTSRTSEASTPSAVARIQ